MLESLLKELEYMKTQDHKTFSKDLVVNIPIVLALKKEILEISSELHSAQVKPLSSFECQTLS